MRPFGFVLFSAFLASVAPAARSAGPLLSPASSGPLAQTADGRLVFATGADNPRKVGVGTKVATVFLGLGYGYGPSEYSRAAFCLFGFNASGALDSGFGKQGAVFTPLLPPENSDYADAVALLQDKSGRLIAVGSRNKPVEAMTALRYTSSGTLDPSFGKNGAVTIHLDGFYAINAYAAALDDQDRLLMVGYTGDRQYKLKRATFDDWSAHVVLARYTALGKPDASFGSNGVVTQPIEAEAEWLHNNYQREFLGWGYKAIGLLVEPDGSVMVAATDSESAVHLMRFDSNGKLDRRFGTERTAQTSMDGAFTASVLLRDHQGRLLVAGTGGSKNESSIALLRYSANGEIDRTFGVNGIERTPLPSVMRVRSAVYDRDNRLLVAATGEHDVLLARYGGDGSLDKAFAPDGVLDKEFPQSTAGRAGLMVDADGVPLVAAAGAHYDGVSLIRYERAEVSSSAIRFRSEEFWPQSTCASPAP